MNIPSIDFTTAEAFEAGDWLADLPQRTWPQAAGRSSDVILLNSTATILAAAMLVGHRTTTSTSLAGAAAVTPPTFLCVERQLIVRRL